MASENIRDEGPLGTLHAALNDPGRYVSRKPPIPVDRGFPEMEPLTEWQLRAVVAALVAEGNTLSFYECTRSHGHRTRRLVPGHCGMCKLPLLPRRYIVLPVLDDDDALRPLLHDWRQEAWECYVASGADPDEADARHLNPGEALAAVKELVEQYDEALKHVPLADDHTMREPPPTRATLARLLLEIYDAAKAPGNTALFNAVRTAEVSRVSRDDLIPLTDDGHLPPYPHPGPGEPMMGTEHDD